MDEVTRYRTGAPAAPVPDDIDTLCGQKADDGEVIPWTCTREENHEGRHEAGMSETTIAASWPNKEGQ